MTPLSMVLFRILNMEAFRLGQRIGNQSCRFQIFQEQLHRMDVRIVIGSVVVDPFVRIDAGAVDRVLIVLIIDERTALRLKHRGEDVEELKDALPLGRRRRGIQLHESGADEPGV